MKIKNIFVTGAIHIGKTTILNNVMNVFPQLKIGGFRTVPIFEKDKKKGFVFESLEGKKKIFAHVDLHSGFLFDIYKFDYTVFEEIGVYSLENALLNSDLILMDEIGLMERQTAKFRQLIVNCLNSSKLVLGAYQERAAWFKNILNERGDTKIIHVSKINRAFIAEQIIGLINQLLYLK